MSEFSFNLFDETDHRIMEGTLDKILSASPFMGVGHSYGSHWEHNRLLMAAASGKLNQDHLKLTLEYDTELLPDFSFPDDLPVIPSPSVDIDYLIKPKYHDPDTMVLRVDSMSNTNITKLGVNNVKDNSNISHHTSRTIPFRHHVLHEALQQCTK